MLTVFMIDGVPDHIHFVKSENFDNVLMVRDIPKEAVMSQEIRLQTLILLVENKSKFFTLCLYKKAK